MKPKYSKKISADSSESVRIDRYLWAIRICKTRSIATELCRAGHVKVGVTSVKPAHPARRGEQITINLDGQTRIIEPVKLIVTRVGAPRARECYLDHSPVTESQVKESVPFLREASSGRPTKRDRRMLDRLRKTSR